MGTIIPIKFDRELTIDELDALVDHLSDFASALKLGVIFVKPKCHAGDYKHCNICSGNSCNDYHL